MAGCWRSTRPSASLFQQLRRASDWRSGREEVIKLSDRVKGEAAKKQRNVTFGSLCLLTVPAAAFSLGVWQVYRLQWKEELIAKLKEQLAEKAIDFPVHDLNSIDDLEYRRVKLRGRFLYDREFIIQPRGRFDEAFDDRAEGGMIGNAAASSHGGHFITPMLLEGTNIVVMVNRGWLPRRKFEEERKRERPDGIVEIEAIVRKSEKRPRYISDNQPEKDVWFYKDFAQMAERCGSLPIYVDAVYDRNTRVGPIGGQTNVNLPNQHFSYLVTWFTLSAVTLGMWCVKYLRRV
ncbi:SURF1-like protein [Aphelenchoides fujianensis]|nr:SURF1-like protein [Aphelenchoides fujianensis]